METTAAIPKMIEAIKSNKRTLLALASRQAILKSQAVLFLDGSGELLKRLPWFRLLKSVRLLRSRFAEFLRLNLNRG